MNNIILYLKKSTKYFAYPFVFTASLMILINALNFVPFDLFSKIYNIFEGNIELLFGTLAVYYACIISTKSGSRAVCCAFCYAIFDITFYSVSNTHYGLVVSVAFSFVISRITLKIDNINLFYILMIICVVVSLIIGACHDYLYSGLRAFCTFVSKKPLLFGAANNIYSLLFGNGFENLMLNTYYSATTVVNNKLVAGVKNAFELNPDAPINSVSYYMSGKYFSSIFVTLGYFIALYNKFSSNEANAFALVSALAFCFGDFKLFALFLLVYNPATYLSYLAISFICYLVPVLLDIRIGFLNNGSLYELIKYGHKWVYFLIAGAIISVMSYFLVQIVISKFDITKNKVLPRDVRRIVTALGGEKNIECINSDSVSVKNPNLIDILKLDCDIHENLITLRYGELEKLKDYF